MNPTDLKQALQVAKQAAVKAGNFLKQHQSEVIIKQYKDIQDIQTDADLQAEKIIIDILKKSFPRHNIFSEEAGFIDNQSPYTWVIDPLDGTRQYFRQLPDFLTCISCESAQELLVGCVYQPSTKELFYAAKKSPAFESKNNITVSQQASLNKSIVFAKPPNPGKTSKKQHLQYWQTLVQLSLHSYRLHFSINDAINICHLAKGANEAFILLGDYAPKWHDLSASLIIAQQAGATITDCLGQPLKNQDLTNGILVTNDHLHDALLNIIKPLYEKHS